VVEMVQVPVQNSQDRIDVLNGFKWQSGTPGSKGMMEGLAP